VSGLLSGSAPAERDPRDPVRVSLKFIEVVPLELNPDTDTPKDWRIVFGLVLTFLWFVFLFVYIARNVGWGSFIDLPIEEMGAFLEGAFAFLAFLWLVIGLFIQQSVLAENNEELRRNNANSEKQTQAIAATELNARQETFFKIAEGTRRQLGAITGLLFISSQSITAEGKYTDEQLDEIWKQFASGDFEIFSRMFLNMQATLDEDEMKVLFFGTEIRRRHSDNFIVGFDRILRLAKECDMDNIITDSIIISAHGLLNIRMRQYHPSIKFAPLTATNSQEYLQRYDAVSTELQG
jgi:hypothetical protein